MNSALTEFIEKRKLEATLFPLRELLLLYYKAPHSSVYNNYMDGFKELYSWLSPIAIPTKAAQYSTLFASYEIQEIAKIVGCHPAIIQATLLEIHYEHTTGSRSKTT